MKFRGKEVFQASMVKIAVMLLLVKCYDKKMDNYIHPTATHHPCTHAPTHTRPSLPVNLHPILTPPNLGVLYCCLLLPHNLYSGTKHIPLLSRRLLSCVLTISFRPDKYNYNLVVRVLTGINYYFGSSLPQRRALLKASF